MPRIEQDLVAGTDSNNSRTIKWYLFTSPEELSSHIDSFLLKASSPTLIGLAVHLSRSGTLESLAFAAQDRVIVLNYISPFSKWGNEGTHAKELQDGPLGSLLSSKRGRLVGFGMARLAMHVRYALSTHVRGADIGDVLLNKWRSRGSSPGQCVKNILDETADSHEVDALWDTSPAELDDSPRRFRSLCLRAWLSVKVAEHAQCVREFGAPEMIDTTHLPSKKTFNCLYRMVLEVEQIDSTKSRNYQGGITSALRNKEGHVIITNERYNTRVRASTTTKVILRDDNGNEFVGQADGTDGKRTTIKPFKPMDGGLNFTTIEVKGKEERSLSEKAQDAFLLQILQGKRDLHDPNFPFIKLIWFPDASVLSPARMPLTTSMSRRRHNRLNESQAAVVQAMGANNTPLVIVHGPPGTGKTFTISAAAKAWEKGLEPSWIVARSNIGVKNIAERLCKDGVAFRLLVSKEFYFEWHEHIYESQVKSRLIRTNELPADVLDVGNIFKGISIVLCTLSTLSNPLLDYRLIFKFVPVVNLVIDEASQIGIFEYLHLFAKFKTLRKACFFGDPKQLPPPGQEVALTLECIFDVQHLKHHAYFLNTQYRMPEALGSFISCAVYNSSLYSVHRLRSPLCVAFVDVIHGVEALKGLSFKNDAEIQTIIHLVRHYYADKNYCILTPYDAQRAALQDWLKKEKLRWDNVFNVDSFQGNEADYVLISVVRTESPGFLTSRRRINVMLSRCKAGMVIVTSRSFMCKQSVAKTLMAELCAHWEKMYGADATWRDWKNVAEHRADLPGFNSSGVATSGNREIASRSSRSAKSSAGRSSLHSRASSVPSRLESRRSSSRASATRASSRLCPPASSRIIPSSPFISPLRYSSTTKTLSTISSRQYSSCQSHSGALNASSPSHHVIIGKKLGSATTSISTKSMRH